MDVDFSKYKVLIAPMLYMVRDGIGERIEKFVADGGVLVTTYWSGIANETDLCFLGGFPGPLRKVTGIWSEEIDALYDQDVNYVAVENDNALGLSGNYEANTFCDLIHAETAEVLATYKEDFYQGRPALTVNSYGKGKAYYIAFRSDDKFLSDFYDKLIESSDLKRALDVELPKGVTVQMRSDGENDYLFILNFSSEEKIVDLKDICLYDMMTGTEMSGNISIQGYGFKIVKR